MNRVRENRKNENQERRASGLTVPSELKGVALSDGGVLSTGGAEGREGEEGKGGGGREEGRLGTRFEGSFKSGCHLVLL